MPREESQDPTQRDPFMHRVTGALALGIMASNFAVGAVTTALVGSVYLLFLFFPFDRGFAG